MKKLPYGISNYEELITENYYYVDKTKYIEKLENLNEKRIMFLRPRKFGKSLFTSVLEYYYDINCIDKFDILFKDTYIGNNPTKLKNRYYILKFNFSGIDTSSKEKTIEGFRFKVKTSIKNFISKYDLNIEINQDDQAENILYQLLNVFREQKKDSKIYVIIDEYDHFANELLGFNYNLFKDLLSKQGKVRKWYEVLKEGTENVVDRIFITGVTPITLDSLTSGFNISTDITRRHSFNEMMGFTEDELKDIFDNQNIFDRKELLPLMKENYDGYKFSSDANKHVYNSNLCLYFLSNYQELKQIPKNLIDMNIASDYKKLSGMLNLYSGLSKEKNKENKKIELLKSMISGEGVYTEIIEKFNPEMKFEKKEFLSLLFYLGYLTIDGYELGYYKLVIPNRVMSEIYTDYFLDSLSDNFNMDVDYIGIVNEIAHFGKIDKISELVHTFLNNLSNRDYQKFDEKYVKLLYYCIFMNFHEYMIVSENEVNREYTDLLIYPRNFNTDYYSILIEFKYLKKDDSSKLEEKKKEALAQIIKYSSNLTHIKNLKKFTVVAVVDELYVDEIKC